MYLKLSDAGRVVFYRQGKGKPLERGVVIRVNPRIKTALVLEESVITEVRFQWVEIVNGRVGEPPD